MDEKKEKDKGERGTEEGQQADENTNTPACSRPTAPLSIRVSRFQGFFLWKLASEGADKYTSMTHALHTLPKQ